MLFYTNFPGSTNVKPLLYTQKEVFEIGVLIFFVVEVYETYDKKI